MKERDVRGGCLGVGGDRERGGPVTDPSILVGDSEEFVELGDGRDLDVLEGLPQPS